MGVVASNQSAGAGSAKSAPLATPRRQTLTGIKTSYKSPHYENVKCTHIGGGGLTPTTTASPRRIPGNLSAQRNADSRSSSSSAAAAAKKLTDENAMVVTRTPTSAGRARRLVAAAESTPSSRRKSKRFMTIGYEGEVGRSPLMERQNIVVTVQRSKSAQTPMGKTTVVKRDIKQNEVRHSRLSAV